ASPNKLIGCEETPALIAFDNTTRDELARNCRVVKPMPSETTRQPQSAFNFANLRHAMDGAAERSVPEMCDAHLPQPGKRLPNVIRQRATDQARTGVACPYASRPLKAITSDDTVVIVGAIGIAYCSVIAHDVV